MNIQRILTLLCTCLWALFAQASDSKPYQFFDEQLEITLPTELKPLSDNALKKRYGKQNVPPNFAFSDSKDSVSFTLTQYPTPAQKKDMKKIHKTISNMLRKASSKAKWKKDKVYKRLGTEIAVYEYEVNRVGKYQYNLTYALPVNDQLTLISFTTTDKKYKQKWLSLARESLDSIKL